ncbi:MAG: NrfD/PsrC family molybdoenzyme membrane anchor subunit [bacterium]
MKTQENSRNRFFWGLTIAALMVGLVGLFDRLTNGHINANYGSYVPWGLWVAGYIYLIGLSAGAFLMSALVYVFRIKAFEKIGRLALLTALATLVGAMLAIWLDLGHMSRVWRMLTQTNFTSVMGWMAWLYASYFILLLIEFRFALRADLVQKADTKTPNTFICKLIGFDPNRRQEYSHEKDLNVLKILGSIGIPLAVAFHGSVGAIFGAVGARPYWNSGLTPIIFLAGALTSGAALLAFVVAVWGANGNTEENRKIVRLLGRIVLVLLATDVLLEWAELSIGLWSSVPSESESLKLVLFGNFWWVFWFVHVGTGVVIPGLLLLSRSRSVTAVGTAGALIAFSFISVRLNIVIPALAVPELEGLKHAFTGPGLTFDYFPSVMEWFLFLFTIGVPAFIFMAGKSILPIIDTETAAVRVVPSQTTDKLKEAYE